MSRTLRRRRAPKRRHPNAAMTSKPTSIFAAFCDYFATGEGRTVIVALGATPQEALTLFEERAPSHFLSGVEIIEFDRTERSKPNAAEKWLAAELLARSEHGPITFFGIFHQNLS